jgi:hypothetical protein
MRLTWIRSSLALTSLALAACGSDSGGGGDDTPGPDADTSVTPDADNTDFIELIGRDWTIPAGQEIYKCVRAQVTEDVYISVFRSPVPLGEHHTVLTVKDALEGGDQVGEYDCDVGELDTAMLYASGVGTDDLAFPDGVAIKVTAGQYLNLNLHLFNANPSEPLSGRSKILVKPVAAVPPEKEAEMVFAGTFLVAIPPGGGSARGGCTFTRPATIMTYWPHMHQHATHQKVDMVVGGTPLVLHDQPFDFEEQTNFVLPTPLQVNAGDSIDVTCTYTNDTDSFILWGDSSNREMCFTGLYRYPKQATDLFECTEGNQ